MKQGTSAIVRTAIVAVGLAAIVATGSLAQGRGGGPPGGGSPPGGGMGNPGVGNPGMGGSPFPNGGPGTGEPRMGGESESRPRVEGGGDSRAAGLQLGPPGVRWWDDHGFAKSLKLRPDQQMKMDAIFEQNRSALINGYEGVREAEAQMQELSKSASPDEAALFTQIDRVAQARAELAKTTTHMFLQIRKEMDADQLKRLEKATPR